MARRVRVESTTAPESELERSSVSVSEDIATARRIASVDFIRFVAISAIIMGHTTPFRELDGRVYEILSVSPYQFALFTVPCFFALAGYFFHLGLYKTNSLGASVSKSFKRILTVYLFWLIVYLLPYDVSAFYHFGATGPLIVSHRAFLHWISSPEMFFLVGPKIHLWFLPAMLCVLIITGLFLRFRQEKALYAFAVLLYLFEMLTGPYSGTPIGLHINFNTRNGPFTGLIFFVMGYWLAARKDKNNWLSMGLVIGSAGFLMQLTEALLLRTLYHIPTITGHYVGSWYYAGTFFFGAGATLVALSGTSLFERIKINKYGIYVIGIYGIHFMFVDIFAPLDYKFPYIVWPIVYPIIVLFLSIVTMLLLDKYAVMRRIIR